MSNCSSRHPIRSPSLAVARLAKRLQPPHDIFDTDFPHLGVLSVLCQRGVALDHRDQKTGSLVWIQVAANCSLGLPSAQERGNSFLPGEEYPLQPLAELLVQRRHLLRQIEQRATFSNVCGPSWQPPDNANQNVDGLPVAKQRMQPPIADKFLDDLVHDGISQSFLAFEMVVEGALGDVGGGKNCVDAGTLEA